MMNIFDKLPKAAPRSQIYKEHLFAIADFILVISEKARREGILALEADVTDDDFYPSFFSSMEKFFFKHLATLMVDGTSQENIEFFAKYYIATIDENDPELADFISYFNAVEEVKADVEEKENHQ